MFLGDPLLLIAGIPAILIAITFHEFAHGKTAMIIGDPTPGWHGRLTLNPIKHLDLIGSLMLVVVGFGWAKPVPVNPLYFNLDRQKGMMLVSVAGPAMNIVLAFFAALFINIFSPTGIFSVFLELCLWFNVVLAIFNLLPVPPLDGSKILAGLLPKKYLYTFSRIEPYGIIILVVLLISGFIGGVIIPVINTIINFLLLITSFTII